MMTALFRNWWAFAVRGVVAILFAVAAVAFPNITLAALIGLFGAYALVDGVLTIVASVRAAERHQRRWPMLLEGFAAALIGVVTFIRPLATALALSYLIAAWAIVTGILKIVGAVYLRRVIRGEWFLIINGVISVLFGLFIMILPAAGLLVIVWWIAGYVFVRGLMLLGVAIQLKRHHHRVFGGSRAG